MRILICVGAFEPSLIFGGLAAVASDHAFELARRGHEVTVLTTNLASLHAPTQHAERFVERDGVRIHYLPARVLYPHFSAVLANGLRAWLKPRLDDFDVIHIHFAREHLPITCAAVARIARKPHVLQTHGNLHNRRAGHRVYDELLTRRALRGASSVLHLQDVEAAQLRAIEPSIRHVALPNGIPIPDEPSSWSASRLALEPKIVFLGRLSPVKRAIDLVDAADILRREGVRAQYQIIGPDNGERAATQARVTELELADCVEFTGGLPRDQAMSRLRDAAIYVQPSTWESFSLTTFEALARGIPSVITTANEFAPELLEAKAALITDPGAQQIARAIGQLLRNPDETAALAARGHEWMKRHYSLGAIVDRLENIYRDAMRAGTGA